MIYTEIMDFEKRHKHVLSIKTLVYNNFKLDYPK